MGPTEEHNTHTQVTIVEPDLAKKAPENSSTNLVVGEKIIQLEGCSDTAPYVWSLLTCSQWIVFGQLSS